jgi:hypothetical protein
MLKPQRNQKEVEIPEPGDPNRKKAILGLVNETRDLIGDISVKMAEIKDLLIDDEGKSQHPI